MLSGTLFADDVRSASNVTWLAYMLSWCDSVDSEWSTAVWKGAGTDAGVDVDVVSLVAFMVVPAGKGEGLISLNPSLDLCADLLLLSIYSARLDLNSKGKNARRRSKNHER